MRATRLFIQYRLSCILLTLWVARLNIAESAASGICRSDDGDAANKCVVPVLGAGRIVDSVLQPIEQNDLKRYKRILSLSEEQMQFILLLHDEYAKRWNKIINDLWPEIDRRNEIISTMDDNNESDLSSVAAFKSYFEEEEKLHQEIVDLDFDFIGKMESILADVQKEKMWRVAADRQRREAKYKYIGLRSIVIDFSEVVQDDLGLTEDELSRVDPVLAEYERETTPLRIKIGQSIRNIRDKEYELLVATVVAPDGHILDAKNESDLELSRAAQRNREGLLTHHAELQLPLEKIQDVYASKIAEALSSVKAKEFTSRYRAIAWPAVYPDMSDPEGLYEAMMADENLAADIRTALKSQWEIYRENYEHICNGMRKCQSQHMFIFASTTRQSDMAQYAQAMIEFRTKRYEVNLKIVKDMKYLIPQDILKWQRGCEAVEKNIHAIMDASDEGIPYPST